MNYIFTNEFMHTALQAMILPDETYQYPVYAGFGKENKFFGSALDNQYGFLAITSLNRLLVTQFTILGTPVKRLALPLSCLNSIQVRKVPLLPMQSIKMIFDVEAERYSIHCHIARKVYAMGLKEQEENLEYLLVALQHWSAA